MEKMQAKDLKNILNWDKCVECGECLVNCQYMNLSRKQAVRQIKKINRNKPSIVHKKCISCYACNAFCPHDAHPYERIHFFWNRRYVEKGLPARASYLMPAKRPNFRQDIFYSQKEKALYKKWAADEPPAEIVLYPGCNFLTMPLLGTGALFEKLPVWGNWDLCCGEMYFRMGLLDPVKKIARKLTDFYKNKKIKEMVFVCPAGYNMFSNVLPKQFGAEFDFKKTFFTDWFISELANNSFEITNPLKKSVVVHDSCHARVLGDDFMNRERKLLKMLGANVYETKNNRSKGLCCGMAAGCTNFAALDIVKASLRQYKALNASPAKEVAIYCTGCLLTLSIIRTLHPFGKQFSHTIELIRQAMGENPEKTSMTKALLVLKGILANAPRGYADPRHFFID